MSFRTNLRVFYVHGLLGRVNGSKGSYLSRFFRVHVSVGMWSLKKDVNAVKFFFRRFFSGRMFTAFNWHNVAIDMLKSCATKQMKELRRFPPDYFDVYLGLSWGGAVMLELMRVEGLIAHDAPILLLSAAPYKIYGHSISPRELVELGRMPPTPQLKSVEEGVEDSPEEEGEVAAVVPAARAPPAAAAAVSPFDDDVPRKSKSKKKKKKKKADTPFGWFPTPNVRAFRCVRVLHGSADGTIPPRHATRICRVLHHKTRLWPIQGGKHPLGCLIKPCSDEPPPQPVPLGDAERMPELADRPVCEFEKSVRPRESEWGKLWRLTRDGSLYWHITQAYLGSGLRERRVRAMEEKKASDGEDGA